MRSPCYIIWLYILNNKMIYRMDYILDNLTIWTVISKYSLTENKFDICFEHSKLNQH